ncbi:TraC family protein [Rhizobium phaseoli]|uniref:Conjugal transfer TraC-like protein n=1 Tax=Rhizobium phaseoli TaxID=396 RepID=A0ABN4QUU3_9HYPH|nr:TraC family protein [Rhizobium phaseoli]KEC69673.1 conjugal transfer protein C [Rhizobium leguminosarum bv. phaseoli CCGM1]ANL57344.1 conjugal transfer TraC-like protein [Rhizobium phaseoli]ANL89242.1 conjugal transfer TraC-like protein [Rhizobium phaseoli]ANL95751.1 conjugal transfer TraC-like protein [Rhizobium phaseoli]PWI51023.1 pilus assembly protein [Rhizobium phaseoli]
MAIKSSISDLDAQIEKLRERKRLLIVKSAERFARAATKSGLAEMEIADEEVDWIVEEIAARFRRGDKKGGAGPAPQTRRPADSSAGAQGQVPHDG